MHWTDTLVEHGAMCEGVSWARGYKTAEEAWAACERGDWMLWCCGHCAGEPWSQGRRKLVATVCRFLSECFAELAVNETVKIARESLAAINDWAQGSHDNRQRVRKAAATANAATDATDATDAAATAAAVYAATYATAAAFAAATTAAATYATASAAAYAAPAPPHTPRAPPTPPPTPLPPPTPTPPTPPPSTAGC